MFSFSDMGNLCIQPSYHQLIKLDSNVMNLIDIDDKIFKRKAK
jgi:hypothetical protein